MIRSLLQGVNYSLKLFFPKIVGKQAHNFSIDLSITPKDDASSQQNHQHYLEINKDISEDLEQCAELFNLIE
jgi:hypothetical protein